jgi:imidazolonepropionase-like amidohydrolase
MHESGVVAARDMAGDARVVSEAARNVLSGQAKGPDLYHVAVMGGPEFAARDPRMTRSSLGYPAGGSPWAQAVTAETDLPLAVARAAGSGATALKLYLGFDAELIAALAAEAHRQGLQVWAHSAVYPARPLEVVRAGVDVLSHACGLAWQDADLDPTPYATANVNARPSFDPHLVEADSPEMTALFAEMVRRGTIFDPTVTNHAHPGDDRFGCTPELTAALTRAAHHAGVPLVTGTDYHLPADQPYPALHDEIEALVDDVGLTNTEALVAATLHGARALGKEADYGTVEPGKLASLVVLAEDPTEDIRALRTVVAVVYRGVVSERAER